MPTIKAKKPTIKKETTAKKTVVKKVEVKKDVKKDQGKVVKNTADSKVTAPSFDLTGKRKGSVSLPQELFGGKINEQLMTQAVRVYLANQRQGTASTKTRSEVTGSRRKVWRQKGTGRARHGSITGPIFVGGGIVHGPKPRDFGLKMPKKMKLQALVSALTEKSSENMVYILDGKLSGKSKEFATIVKTVVASDKKKKPSILFVRNNEDKQALLASRNVEKIVTVTGSDINTYGVMRSSAILISKDAIEEMKKTFIKTL